MRGEPRGGDRLSLDVSEERQDRGVKVDGDWELGDGDSIGFSNLLPAISTKCEKIFLRKIHGRRVIL